MNIQSTEIIERSETEATVEIVIADAADEFLHFRLRLEYEGNPLLAEIQAIALKSAE